MIGSQIVKRLFGGGHASIIGIWQHTLTIVALCNSGGELTF
jgi:hypothetical protein